MLVSYRAAGKVKYDFYLPHMEYEGSIGLVTGKMKKYLLLIFTF
jgi:hypothetical protein